MKIKIGDTVKGVHASGWGVRGKVRAINGSNIHVDNGDGKVSLIDISTITIVNGKKVK